MHEPTQFFAEGKHMNNMNLVWGHFSIKCGHFWSRTSSIYLSNLLHCETSWFIFNLALYIYTFYLLGSEKRNSLRGENLDILKAFLRSGWRRQMRTKGHFSCLCVRISANKLHPHSFLPNLNKKNRSKWQILKGYTWHRGHLYPL